MDIPFTQWMPDSPEYERDGDIEATNVIPAKEGYRPFLSFAATTSATGSNRIQGAFFARAQDGSGYTFAGDSTKLYLLIGTSWTDVSGTTYNCPADGGWSFTQFGYKIIATNGADNPQVYTIGSSSAFADLGGSPPVSRYSCTAKNFMFLANNTTNASQLYWSGLGDATTWSQSQTTQADNQIFTAGGFIQGIVGLDVLVVLQEFHIRRGQYVSNPAIWDFDEISENVGLTIPGSLAVYKERIFFCDRSGFYQIISGAPPLIPIGAQRINIHFWNEVNQQYLNRVTSAIDPINACYIIFYPNLDSTDGTPNHGLVYQWDVDKWSHFEPGMGLEYVWSGATQSGYTLDGLDAVSTNLDTLPFSLDSAVWTGVARRFTSAFDTSHKLGFFTGLPLAASIVTAERELSPNRRTYLSALRPITDAPDASVTIITRNRILDPVVTGTANEVDADGYVYPDVDSRYMRVQLDITSSVSWNHVQGLDDLQFRPSGRV